MPDKIIHPIQVDGYCARFGGKWGRLQLGTFGSYGIEQLQIALGDSWTDLVVYANFVTADGTTPVLVPESGLVDVPPEATAKPGMANIVLDGTAADGQQWVCDEVDFDTLSVNQFAYKWELVFDSKDIFFNVTDMGNTIRGEISLPTGSNSAIYSIPGLCNRFKRIYDYKKDAESYYISPSIAVFKISKSRLNSYDSAGLKEYFDSNPTSVVYVLSTPIITPLSAEELTAYAALRSYNGTTIVSTEAPVAGLSARYVADGAAYIDSKIQAAVTQAVAAAVSLTGGAQ